MSIKTTDDYIEIFRVLSQEDGLSKAIYDILTLCKYEFDNCDIDIYACDYDEFVYRYIVIELFFNRYSSDIVLKIDKVNNYVRDKCPNVKGYLIMPRFGE